MIKFIDGIEFNTDCDELVGHYFSEDEENDPLNHGAEAYQNNGEFIVSSAGKNERRFLHRDFCAALYRTPGAPHLRPLWVLWLGSGAVVRLSEDEAFTWLVNTPSEECDHQAKLEQYFPERLIPGFRKLA